ncbi:MAG: hypothetical protein WHS44_12970 [Fimbriimonadales bacterium]
MILVCTETRHRNFPFRAVFAMLGIDATYAIASASGLETPSGVIAWTNTTTIRNYLQQFDAVLVFGNNDRITGGDRAIHRTLQWLNWNNPEDPPIAYLRVGVHSSLAQSNLPTDFPIIPPNPSDISNTTITLPGASGNAYDKHAGLRVRLEREGTELYIPCAMIPNASVDTGTFHLYYLDTTKHTALGSNGEILVRPVGEDITIPNNAVAGYRYRKHAILPTLIRTTIPQNYYTTAGIGYFWLLYALKYLGVRPLQRIPIFFVMDDALTINRLAGGTGQPTIAQFARIARITYDYLANTIHPQTGLAMVCGLLTGGRYGRRSEPLTSVMQEHWNLVRAGKYWTDSNYSTLPTDAQEELQAWHQLLVDHHYGGLPCTIHDHTIRHRQNRIWASFTRHSDYGYQYAAPNDVPKASGTALIRKEQWAGAPPAGAYERIVDGAVYYELNAPTTGNSATIDNLSMRSLHGARIAWESAVAEMHALGFPDAHGTDRYRLIISPNFLTGGPAVWQALQEIGYRMVRCIPPINNSTLSPEESDYITIPPNGIWDKLHFLGSFNWDCGSATGGTYGLYHPTQTSETAVVINGLDSGGDITSIWSTDPITASLRAYRRYIGMATEHLLRGFCLGRALPVAHPPSMLSWADIADPLKPFDPNDPNRRINFLLEITHNVLKVVKVLSDYLYFGSVSDLIKVREKVMQQ